MTTTVGTPGAPAPTVLDPAGSLAGVWTEQLGTDLAFHEGELLLGAPSSPGEVRDSQDDVAWLTVGGIAAFGGELNFALDEPPPSLVLIDDQLTSDWDMGVNPANDGFGTAVLQPGDVSGDGTPDLVVSQRQF